MSSASWFTAGMSVCLSILVIIAATALLIKLWVRSPKKPVEDNKPAENAIKYYFVVYLAKQKDGGFVKHCQVETYASEVDIQSDYDAILAIEKEIATVLEDGNAVTIVHIEEINTVWTDNTVSKNIRIRQ